MTGTRCSSGHLYRLALCGVAALALLSGCLGSSRSSGPRLLLVKTGRTTIRLVPAPQLRHQCAQAAIAVRYPVPCPSFLPYGWQGYPLGGGCSGARFVGVSCSALWRGWVVGGVGIEGNGPEGQHFVVEASPDVASNPSLMVNGPIHESQGQLPQSLGSIDVGPWAMEFVYVPYRAGSGSIMQHHLMLLWTVGGHTYAEGFHVYGKGGMRLARKLDVAEAEHMRLVFDASSEGSLGSPNPVRGGVHGY